jgi:hypothetical protein
MQPGASVTIAVRFGYRIDYHGTSQLMRSKPTDSLRSCVSTPKQTRASLDTLLGLACDSEKAGLKFAWSHSSAVIDNPDHTAIRLAEAFRQDCHCTGVGVVAVLNKLN